MSPRQALSEVAAAQAPRTAPDMYGDAENIRTIPMYPQSSYVTSVRAPNSEKPLSASLLARTLLGLVAWHGRSRPE